MGAKGRRDSARAPSSRRTGTTHSTSVDSTTTHSIPGSDLGRFRLQDTLTHPPIQPPTYDHLGAQLPVDRRASCCRLQYMQQLIGSRQRWNCRCSHGRNNPILEKLMMGSRARPPRSLAEARQRTAGSYGLLPWQSDKTTPGRPGRICCYLPRVSPCACELAIAIFGVASRATLSRQPAWLVRWAHPRARFETKTKDGTGSSSSTRFPKRVSACECVCVCACE